MSAGEIISATGLRGTAPAHVDLAAEAGELVAGLSAHPWGQVSASVYETGRLVSLAPWLTGHAERLDFLMAAQRQDGGWGPHEAYSLVPTLSATEALLRELGRVQDAGREIPDAGHALIAKTAARGLDLLLRWSRRDYGAPFPDIPAIELIVPSLVSSINRCLRGEHVAGLGTKVSAEGLPLPRGMNGAKLKAVRARLRAGGDLPVKLLHALEAAGAAAARAPGVRPTAIGTVGASPAATAAWLGDLAEPAADDPAYRHLRAVAERYGGPAPVTVPITVFERGWVLSWLRRAGVSVPVPGELVAGLRDGLGPAGVAAGPGLPADADTTSVALYALALLDVPQEPESLRTFQVETHFCTWPGEQGFSATVNAHVLDAFGEYVARRPEARPRYARSIADLTALLCERQRDGHWSDRWHASPYYATVCCALALDDFGGESSAHAVRQAVRWVLSTQRADGSWGLWRGTREETAYAVQILLLTRAARAESARDQAAARGYAYLLQTAEQTGDPAMWHDKDVYNPIAIVRAAILGAIHLARRELDVTSPGGPPGI